MKFVEKRFIKITSYYIMGLVNKVRLFIKRKIRGLVNEVRLFIAERLKVIEDT
jgi:hypothetical protein